MNKQQFDILTEKYLNGEATQDEKKLVEEYLIRLSKEDIKEFSESDINAITKSIYSQILNQLEASRAAVIPFYKKSAFKVAVAVAFILGIGSYFAINNNTEKPSFSKAATIIHNDAVPGKDGAILTLADGKQIVLDSAANGKITDVAVKNGSQVSYLNSATTRVEYNTMTTPKGRQFSLVLADGTRVWLNAASSIRYPTVFAGNERRVEITGEVYFEVTNDAAKPFHVNVNDIDVRVLGTHFNINSYPDEESIKTSLLEGAVKITSSKQSAMLNPGQQAILFHSLQKNADSHHEIKIINGSDMDAVMAWKNGFFSFSNADIKTVLRQISRWYDLEVIYQGKVPDEKLDGRIPRNVNASAVLGALQFTGIRFKIEGNKIYVAS